MESDNGYGYGLAAAKLSAKRDAHLHRPGRSHRIAVGEEGSSKRDPVDEILEEVAQLQLGFHRIESLAVTLAVRRRQCQCGIEHQPRNTRAFTPQFDLPFCDGRQARHGGIDAKARFLRGNGDDGTDILRRWRYFQRSEGRVDVRRPPRAIGGSVGKEPADQCAPFGSSDARISGPGRRFHRGATGQCDREPIRPAKQTRNEVMRHWPIGSPESRAAR